MKKLECLECGRKREAHRLVARLVDGTVTAVCRRCWIDWDYGAFYHAVTDEERRLMRRL